MEDNVIDPQHERVVLLKTNDSTSRIRVVKNLGISQGCSWDSVSNLWIHVSGLVLRGHSLCRFILWVNSGSHASLEMVLKSVCSISAECSHQGRKDEIIRNGAFPQVLPGSFAVFTWGHRLMQFSNQQHSASQTLAF